MLMIYLAAIETDANKSKFETIYTEYRAIMFYVAKQILNNDQDSEDVVHQAFEKIIEIIDKIEVAKCPKTKSLVVTIVERKAIDLYRAQRRRVILPIDEENIHIHSPSRLEAIPDSINITQAIAMLSPKYRSLLLLKYDNGYSDWEIAQMLSMSVANVRKTIQRAKDKLKIILAGQEATANADN